MPDYAATFFFDGVQAQFGATAPAALGWTETWYLRNFASPELALQEMRGTGVESYLRYRLAFMPSIYRCRWLRVSQVDKPGITKIAGLQGAQVGNLAASEENGGIAGLFNAQPAQINCAILVDLYAPPRDGGKSVHRRFLMRGLPKGLMDGNVLNEMSPLYQLVLNFLNYIAVGPAPQVGGMLRSPYHIRTQAVDVPFVPIGALEVAATNDRQISINWTHGAIPASSRFRVRGVKFPAGVNRIWTALHDYDANVAVTTTSGRRRLAGIWDHTGMVQQIKPDFVRPTQYTVIGLRNKKTGGPFRLTRGRRRA